MYKMAKKTYSEKLQDPRWQKKRLEVFNRDNFACVLCGDKDNTLHVHHMTYKHGKEPWEYEYENFKTVCKFCHLIYEDWKGIEEHFVIKAITTKTFHDGRIMSAIVYFGENGEHDKFIYTYRMNYKDENCVVLHRVEFETFYKIKQMIEGVELCLD